MPIRWRLTVFNALSIGAILVVLGLSLFLLLRNALFSEVEETVRDQALIAAQVVESGERLDPNETEQLSLGVFIVVRDGQGRILDQTVSLVPPDEIQDPIWSRALETGQPVGGTAYYSPSASDYVYAVPVYPPDGLARVVEAGRSYEPATKILETFAVVLVAVILAVLLLSVVGAYLLARAALSPVDTVVRAARQIGESDLSKRLPVVHPKDEIGRLTTTINDLLGRLEAAFARQEEALSRQRRFAADASPELRTPLTSITGYAQMLKDWSLEDPKTARESVSAILEESERMRKLVESLLILARGDAGAPLELSRGDLSAVAADAVRAARAAADGKVAVEYVPPGEPVEASFDETRIRQVAAILLDNAIKYTPEGGTVAVSVGQENGWAKLEVSDTGIGIPADELPRVFERFHRVDPARAEGGVGLGLSIARQIARAHGGEIEAESEPGEGSIFVLRIPRSRSAP
ncbi:MAG TPA: HAMP domain-containing sensor histidine kinase [Rubrobacteraceae bacterium]|nr:HAMP domain-containing sensor histidine kinase [Rubrobacteraceae bacterium]